MINMYVQLACGLCEDDDELCGLRVVFGVTRNSRHRMNTRRIGRFRITSGLSLSTKTRISKNITTLRKLRDHVRWRVAVLIKAPTAHLCLDADD